MSCNRSEYYLYMAWYNFPTKFFMKPIEFAYRPLTDKYLRQADIAYGDKPRQKMDVYSPKNANNLPVIVFIYGGSWVRGSKQGYAPVAASLARMGYVVVTPDYRLYPEVKFPDFVDDGAAAVAWTVGNIKEFGGNNKNINIIGHSAGGMIGALVTVEPKYLEKTRSNPAVIKRLVGLAGSYNSPLETDFFRKIFPDRPKKPPFRAVNVIGSTTSEMLLIHGAKDKLIPFKESPEMAEAYLSAGGQAKAIIMPGLGHTGVMLNLVWPLNKLRPKMASLITGFVK